MNYIHYMIFGHYLLLTLAILPFIYKYSFWLYVIQLKEYRWDRFKEYLSTPQWNSALINIWSVLEFILFIASFYVFFKTPFEINIWDFNFKYFNEPFEGIVFMVFLYYLLILNLFVFRKIIKAKFLKPKLTGRLLLTLWLVIILIASNILYLWYFEFANYIYIYLMSIFLFAPYIIYFIVLITLPFVNLKKNQKIQAAINKTNNFNEPIKIGITWSYWKSSVKEYLSSILEQEWTTLKTPENINSELWVSELILKKLNNSYKYFVAEMWAYKIGEIDLLWKIVNHKYGFLTAIWNQHLWLFWSLENIKKWKLEIVNSVIKNQGTLYVNWNNKTIRESEFDEWLHLVKYWNHEWSDAKFILLWINEWITKFSFEYNWCKSIFSVPIVWEHNIINITWVLAFCYDLWFKTSDLLKYLKNIKSPKNTLTITKTIKHTIIDDTYNLSEDWLLAWLEVLNSYEWNKVLVMDDILELWKDAEKIHYELWKKIATEKLINNIFYVWVNYKSKFLSWLFDWWFDINKVINRIDQNLENSIILFEWRNASKYIDNLIKNV